MPVNPTNDDDPERPHAATPAETVRPPGSRWAATRWRPFSIPTRSNRSWSTTSIGSASPRTPGGDDLLSLLLSATGGGSGPDESEIRSQLATVLFAGHETSATALTWALYELGRKPAVAGRLRAEVDDAVDGRCATLADLPDLGYTEQVLRETLRRYPPAAAIFREADEAVPLGDYRLLESTYVVLPQFHVHTDARWWDDPLAFDPSRWDDVSQPPSARDSIDASRITARSPAEIIKRSVRQYSDWKPLHDRSHDGAPVGP